MLSLRFHVPVLQLRLNLERVVEAGGKDARAIMQKRYLAGKCTDGSPIPRPEKGNPPMMLTGATFRSMKLRIRGEGSRARSRVVFAGERSRRILRAQWALHRVRLQGLVRAEWARVQATMREELVRQQASGEYKL